MSEEYYYIEGVEQYGPFTIAQLKDHTVTSETLVWAEHFDKWLPAKEIADLAAIISKKVPPPIPIEHIRDVAAQRKAKPEDLLLEDKNLHDLLWLKYSFIIFLICAFFSAVIYFYFEVKRHNLKGDLLKEFTNVFTNETIRIDGSISPVKGDYIPKAKVKEFLQARNSHFQNIPLSERKDDVTGVFIPTNGGFTAKQVTKISENGFQLESYSSTALEYIVPKKYYSDTQTPVNACYHQAFMQLLNYHGEESYAKGELTKISSLPDLRNEYYLFENTRPANYYLSEHSASWYGSSEGCFYGDDWRLYYKLLEGRHYELTLDKESYYADLFLALSITNSILLSIIILYCYRKHLFRNRYLFGEKWFNKNDQSNVLLFKKGENGKHQVIELKNGKVFKGELNLTDNGTAINMIVNSEEKDFRIDELSAYELKITSLIEGTTIIYKNVADRPETKPLPADVFERLDEV